MCHLHQGLQFEHNDIEITYLKYEKILILTNLIGPLLVMEPPPPKQSLTIVDILSFLTNKMWFYPPLFNCSILSILSTIQFFNGQKPMLIYVLGKLNDVNQQIVHPFILTSIHKLNIYQSSYGFEDHQIILHHIFRGGGKQHVAYSFVSNSSQYNSIDQFMVCIQPGLWIKLSIHGITQTLQSRLCLVQLTTP